MLARRVLSLIAAGATVAACSKAPTAPTTPTPATTVSVTITGGGTAAHPGQTFQLKAVAHLSDGTDVDVTATADWKSLNPAVISVSATGLVTALAPGTCDVEAISAGVKGQAKLEVTGAIERIEVEGSLIFDKHGDARQLKAIAHYSGGATVDVTAQVTWTSSNPDVVAVTNAGVVTARGDGDCDVTATLQSLTARSPAKVRSKRIVSLRIDGNLSLVLLGQSSHLKAIATLSGGEEIDVTALAEWRTSQPGVALIGHGVLQAMGPGDCEVIALHGGLTARAAVRVSLDVLKVIRLTVTGLTSLRVGQTLQLKAMATMSDGSEVDVTGIAKWTTSDLLIGLVADAGLLTALVPGTCDAIAVHEGVSATLRVRVTLVDEP